MPRSAVHGFPGLVAAALDADRTELDSLPEAVKAGSSMPVTPHNGRQALRSADCALDAVLIGRIVALWV